MIAENQQAVWAAMQRGQFITDTAEQAVTNRKKGARLLVRRRGPTAAGSRFAGLSLGL